MRKLMDLTTYLLNGTRIQREKVHAYADQGKLLPTGKDLGMLIGVGDEPDRRQLEVGIWSYEAVINIQNYPFDGPTLLAMVLAWCSGHDAERQEQGLKDPEVTIELNDALTCDVEISIELEESLTVVSAIDGPIWWEGKRWQLTEPIITPAERLTGMQGRIDNG